MQMFVGAVICVLLVVVRSADDIDAYGDLLFNSDECQDSFDSDFIPSGKLADCTSPACVKYEQYCGQNSANAFKCVDLKPNCIQKLKSSLGAGGAGGSNSSVATTAAPLGGGGGDGGDSNKDTTAAAAATTEGQTSQSNTNKGEDVTTAVLSTEAATVPTPKISPKDRFSKFGGILHQRGSTVGSRPSGSLGGRPSAQPPIGGAVNGSGNNIIGDGRDVDSRCCQWARQGECERNPFFMKPSCQTSCGTIGCLIVNAASCPVVLQEGTCLPQGNNNTGGSSKLLIDPNCRKQNRHTLCDYWASQNQCRDNARYMLLTCGCSCRGASNF